MPLDEVEVKKHLVRLERVQKSPELLRLIPRVVAAGFGVLPLERGDGWLEVAATPPINPEAIAALSVLLELEVRAVPVAESLVHVYINRLYKQPDNINFHTFKHADFLEDPEARALLLEEKPHEPVPATRSPAPGRLVLLDYSYKSYLWDLDGQPVEPTFEAGETDLPFEVHGRGRRARAVLARPRPVGSEVCILAAESYAIQGWENSHGMRTREIEQLPFMVHPTELQITGVDQDGNLALLIYDDVVTVAPGDTPRFDVQYYFLSLGRRQRRHLILKINGLWSVRRDRLVLSTEALPWSNVHLTRWLGQDLHLEPTDGKVGGEG